MRGSEIKEIKDALLSMCICNVYIDLTPSLTVSDRTVEKQWVMASTCSYVSDVHV